MHLRVAGVQGGQERAVAAAEIADADGAVLLADDLEMAAGEKLVRNPYVALAPDDQSVLRDLEFLPHQRPLDADQYRPPCRSRLGRAHAAHLRGELRLVDDAL